MAMYRQIAVGIGTMENQRLEKNFQLRLLKYLLFWSLSFFMIQDTSSATDMKCEIKSSCPLSGCQHTNPMIVDPDSNITRKCSIRTGMLAQGMTWKQARQAVQNGTGLSDLVLLQSNSAKDSGSVSCYCASISFTRKLQAWTSSTPRFYDKGVPIDLKCFFSGWPLPREVQWYKNGEIITNGTERIYHSEDKKWKKGVETLRSTLHLPPGREKQEGFYKCSARNSIPGWKSETFKILQMIYQCPLPKGPTIDSLEVLAAKYSNVNLSCWIDHDPGFFLCSGEWYLNDNQAPLERGEKYKIVEKKTLSKCKTEFILSISNVTKNDRGTYSCHWLCDFINTTKAAIDLKVFDNQPTVQATTESATTSPKNALLSSPPSGIRREWLLLIVILSASIGVLFVLCVWFVVKKKKASALYTKTRNSIALDLAGGY